jgi:nicotinamide mononucleotide transporter
MIQDIMQWIVSNYIELIGSLLGIIYVILATRENSWCWLIGILNVLIYIYVFYQAGIFGNMGLQVLYLIISIYGWYQWVKGGDSNGLRISKIKVNQIILCLVVALGLFVMVYFLLSTSNQNPSIHILDATTTSLGVIGTWLQARKILENWLLWLIADSLSVILYLSQSMYPTAIFYFIMILLAVNGYFVWNKLYKKSIV